MGILHRRPASMFGILLTLNAARRRLFSTWMRSRVFTCSLVRSLHEERRDLYIAAVVLIAAVVSFPSHAETEAQALDQAKAANSRKDYTAAFTIYRELEQRGSAAGIRFIGLMYYAGAGVPKDQVRACDQFTKAEQAGDAEATELLGDCYYNGAGRERDYIRSAQLYTTAGTRGVSISFCALGNQYLRGEGVERDVGKAAALCRESADLGVAGAQTDLGQMYLTGQGVPRAPTEAARWFQKASSQGHANAALLLGKQYWNGDGVERDRPRAASLWRVAALQGQRTAPALLAQHYFTLALDPSGPRLNLQPAIRAAYWGSIAAQYDPDPAARVRAKQLVDMILNVGPSLKSDLDAMLTGRQPPSE